MKTINQNSVCHYAVIVSKRLIFQIVYCIGIWCDPIIEEVLRLYALHCEDTARMNFDAWIIWYEFEAYQLHNAMLCCPLGRMSQHWHPFRVASPQRRFCWSQQQHPREWCLVRPCRLCQHHRPVVSLQLQYLLLWLRLANSQSLAARWRQSIKSQGHILRVRGMRGHRATSSLGGDKLRILQSARSNVATQAYAMLLHRAACL